LADAGAVVGCFELETSKGLEGTVEQIRELGREAIAVTGDVTKGGDLSLAMEWSDRRIRVNSISPGYTATR
jgi:hypothetical protein